MFFYFPFIKKDIIINDMEKPTEIVLTISPLMVSSVRNYLMLMIIKTQSMSIVKV